MSEFFCITHNKTDTAANHYYPTQQHYAYITVMFFLIKKMLRIPI